MVVITRARVYQELDQRYKEADITYVNHEQVVSPWYYTSLSVAHYISCEQAVRFHTGEMHAYDNTTSHSCRESSHIASVHTPLIPISFTGPV